MATYWILSEGRLVQKEKVGTTPTEWEDAIFDTDTAAMRWLENHKNTVSTGTILEVTDTTDFHVEAETTKVLKFH
jgi:hypothetical protein